MLCDIQPSDDALADTNVVSYEDRRLVVVYGVRRLM